MAPGAGTSVVISAAYTGTPPATLTNRATVSTTNRNSFLVNNPASAVITILPPMPNIDTDGDGMLDCAELIAGADPGDPTSFLRLWLEPSLTQNEFLLNFHGVSGRTYSIHGVTNLNGDAWNTVTGGISGDGNLKIIPDSNDTQRTYYRLNVTQP